MSTFKERQLLLLCSDALLELRGDPGRTEEGANASRLLDARGDVSSQSEGTGGHVDERASHQRSEPAHAIREVRPLALDPRPPRVVLRGGRDRGWVDAQTPRHSIADVRFH